MMEFLYAPPLWLSHAAAVFADVAIKATVVCLLALAVTWCLGKRRVLARSATWNACLLALALLPVSTALFPTLRLPFLPAAPAGRTAESARMTEELGQDGTARERASSFESILHGASRRGRPAVPDPGWRGPCPCSWTRVRATTATPGRRARRPEPASSAGWRVPMANSRR